MYLNQIAFDWDACWVQCMHLKLGLNPTCCQDINAWPGPHTGRPILTNATSMLINPLNLASRLFFLCFQLFMWLSNVYKFVISYIYLQKVTVLFILLTCLTEQICQIKMFTFFCLSTCTLKKICKWSFCKFKKGPHQFDTYLLRRMIYVYNLGKYQQKCCVRIYL